MIEEFQDKIFEAIQLVVQEAIKKLKFDYTIIGKVVGEEGGLYNVEYMGQIYPTQARPGLVISTGTIVYVKIIQGDFAQRFIDFAKL